MQRIFPPQRDKSDSRISFFLSLDNSGADTHFVNNYGVWYDEFEALGLEHTIDKVWDGAVSYFGEDGKVLQ